MDSKDLDVKMKIRRIINTPGTSDRTIIDNIQGDKGVGKLINTLNQKLEDEIKDEEKITTIKLINPVKVTNPDVTIYDTANFDNNWSNLGKLAYLECDNRKIKVNYVKPGCFYSEINLTVNDNWQSNIYRTLTDLLTELTLSTTIYVNGDTNYSFLVDKYLTEEECDAIDEKHKIVAIKNIEKHPLLSNEYCISSGIWQIPENFETVSDGTSTIMSAVLYSTLDPAEILEKCPPTLILDIGDKLGLNSKIVLEGSTVYVSPGKIIFKPIYTSDNILYPVMTYSGEANFENSIGKYIYKWTLKATVKAYS